MSGNLLTWWPDPHQTTVDRHHSTLASSLAVATVGEQYAFNFVAVVHCEKYPDNNRQSGGKRRFYRGLKLICQNLIHAGLQASRLILWGMCVILSQTSLIQTSYLGSPTLDKEIERTI